MSLKRSDLVDVADELNKELGLDPAIDTKKKIKDLKDLVIEAGKIVDQDEDELSELTWSTLEHLQVVDRNGESSSEKQEETESTQGLQKAELTDQIEAEKDSQGTKSTGQTEEEEQSTNQTKVKEDNKRRKQFKEKTKTQKRVEFLTPLINEGKYTRTQLLDLFLEQFSDAPRSTIHTMLIDAKNPRYNKFDRLVVEDENKIMRFED